MNIFSLNVGAMDFHAQCAPFTYHIFFWVQVHFKMQTSWRIEQNQQKYEKPSILLALKIKVTNDFFSSSHWSTGIGQSIMIE